jgi:hypothetical protein
MAWLGRDVLQHAAPGRVRARKAPFMTEWAVGDDRDAVLLAPRDHGVLDLVAQSGLRASTSTVPNGASLPEYATVNASFVRYGGRPGGSMRSTVRGPNWCPPSVSRDPPGSVVLDPNILGTRWRRRHTS